MSGFTFLKATQSGWDKFYKDDYTTLKETRDRLCATSMEATWRWQRNPASFETANAKVLDRMLEVFATTYSESVQDSLYRMATAALEAVSEVSSIHLACPTSTISRSTFRPSGWTTATRCSCRPTSRTARSNAKSVAGEP